MKFRLAVFITAIFPTVATAHLAQTGDGSTGMHRRYVVNAMRVEQAPELDGRLAEAFWGEATAVDGFIQREPVEGVPAGEDTEVRFVYTQEALYVAARMEGDPAEIRRDVSRRDGETDAEQLVLSFDTFYNRRTAYTFVVTAAGGRIDYLHPNDSEDSRDYSFDPLWEVETSVDGGGWTAEIRIPFTQLRFNAADTQLWGLNVKRVRPALQQESLWQLVGRDETGWASRMGQLVGISGVRPRRRVGFQTYLASFARLMDGVDPGRLTSGAPRGSRETIPWGSRRPTGCRDRAAGCSMLNDGR